MPLMTGILTPKPELAKDRQLFDHRALKAMILPLFLEQVLQLAVGLADTLMVSYAGEETVSGVSLDAMLYTVFIFLFSAIATGGAVVVSQYLGSRDSRKAGLAASQIFLIAGVVSFACMALILPGSTGLLAFLYPKVEPGVMRASVIYLRIAALSFPANALYNAGAALYRSMGKTRVTLFVSILMNLLNAAGNAVGIFVFHAGAAGVAWPTTVSWWFAAVLMTRLCLKPGKQVTVRLRDMLRIDPDMDRRILRMAVPNAVENTLFQLAKVVLGTLVATFGTAQIAANGIGQTIWSFAGCMSMTMSPVFITVIGQCIGKGDAEAADWYMRRLIRLTIILCASWNALVLAFVPLILPLYRVSEEAKHLIWVIVIIHNIIAVGAHPFYWPLSSGLRAAGDARFAMWTSFFSTVVCRTFFSYLLGLWLGMGVIGITLAMCIDWIIKSILDIGRWHSGKWKAFRVI